jgi:hypothetical protein
MPLTGASLPGFTNDPNFILALMLVANDDAQIKFIVDLFGGIDGFVGVNPGRMRTKIEQERRRVVTEFNSRPGQAVQLDAEKVSVLEPINFSMKLGFPLDDAKLEDLQVTMPGEPSVMVADIQAAAREWVMRGMERRTRIIVRSYAALLAQMLHKTNLVYTMDKVSVNIDNAWIPSASRIATDATWATASTNIAKSWNKIRRLFRKQAGGEPTHVIVGPEFGEKFLSGNEFIADFIASNPAFLNVGVNWASLLGAADFTRVASAQAGLTLHTCELYDEAGTELWDSDYMTLLRNPQQACRHWSGRTLDADWKAGLYTKEWVKDDPKQEMRAVGLNASPAILDFTQIMRVKLTG